VVGVIANLAFYFAIHTLFRQTNTITNGPLQLTVPEVSSARLVSLAISVVAAVLTFRLKWSVLRVLAGCAAIGLIAALAGLKLT
jgi:chromate transporter